MGYWSQDDEGHSFAESTTDPGMTWGDTPADIVGDAIEQIKAAFVRDLDRLPTKAEVIAGLQFTTAVLDDLPATVAEAEAKGAEVLKGWWESEPTGYYREPRTLDAQAYDKAYYGITDPATTINQEFLASAFRSVQREHWKTLNSVIQRLEVKQ